MIFARSASNEARHKCFHSSFGKNENEKVAAYLNNRVIESCSNSGIPFYIVNQYSQNGATFGQRLANAYQQVFDRGYQNIIAVGNDCPQLSVKDLESAKHSLESGENTLGPTLDGGVYLIGINRTAFDFDQFQSIEWKTSKVLNQLIDQLGVSDLLETKTDIDQPLTRHLAFDSCLSVIWQLIVELIGDFTILNSNGLRLNPIAIQSLSHRGPPLF
ncbi:MAG: DUF2064 domain-containing protein [Cyclobacteriaceae bacterium]